VVLQGNILPVRNHVGVSSGRMWHIPARMENSQAALVYPPQIVVYSTGAARRIRHAVRGDVGTHARAGVAESLSNFLPQFLGGKRLLALAQESGSDKYLYCMAPLAADDRWANRSG